MVYLKHWNGPELPEELLVLGVAGREVPEGSTAVADDGEGGRA